jgi:hypothetical protein
MLTKDFVTTELEKGGFTVLAAPWDLRIYAFTNESDYNRKSNSRLQLCRFKIVGSSPTMGHEIPSKATADYLESAGAFLGTVMPV